MISLQDLLCELSQRGGSDLHIISGALPSVRVDGKILPIGNEIITDAVCLRIATELMTDYQKKSFEGRGDCDMSYTFRDRAENSMKRCRVNVFQDMNGTSFAIRLLSDKIPSIDKLGLPNVLKNLSAKPHGLIALTGPTGSGKTTTLSAMVDYINNEMAAHILTIEDPIEYVYEMKQSIISQREVGKHVVSFAAGLKAALREDPNVILVGEMRDKETIEIALNAAETGHLVLTTLHTSNVIDAVDRILQYFPTEQQNQIQLQLANCFEGIIAQRLFKRKNSSGRIAALEIMLRTPATINLIRTGRAFQLKDYLRLDGMQTMDNSIAELKAQGMIN